jgi:hypothetical protein
MSYSPASAAKGDFAISRVAEGALVACRRCHQFINRGSPVQRYCSGCAADPARAAAAPPWLCVDAGVEDTPLRIDDGCSRPARGAQVIGPLTQVADDATDQDRRASS